MHRLTLIVRRFAVVLTALSCLALAVGCAGEKPLVRDPAHVETLRLKITKVRNAIEETRQTIALSRGAPYLPELYVRLAELLSEEARYHYQLAYEREQRATRVLHVPQVRVLKEEAIEIYQLVIQRFPDSPLVPRALYNIGHEHRELGNFDAMRSTLRELVTKYPDTPLRYDALLVLGDYHFDRVEFDDAKVYYKDITKGKLNKLSGLAHYKLAWVWVNEGTCDKAIREFEQAIVRTEEWESPENRTLRLEAARVNGDEQSVAQQEIDVRRESLVDMAYCYSREKSSKGAIAYFQKMAYNRATYLAALDKLANRYRVMEKSDGAVDATRELLWLGPANEDRLDDARTFYTGIKKAKAFGTLGEDVRLIANALIRFYARTSLDDESRVKLREEFEIYIRDLITTAQAALVAMKEGPDRTANAVALGQAYTVYVDTFPDSERLAEMLLNFAEVLALADDELNAGLRSLQAAQLLPPEAEERSNALYDAVVHLQQSVDKEAGRQQYERVTARAALRLAASELLALKIDANKARLVKFAIAQTYYDGGQYTEAIDRLTAVAYEFPSTEEGDAAINLVLDSYYTLNDSDGLMFAGRRFMDPSSPASDKLKADIKPIVLAAEEKKLDQLSLSTAGEEGNGAGVDALQEFAKTNEGTPLGERALLNAFVAARAVGDTDKLNEIADEIAKKYPSSEQLPGIYASLAQSAVARFEFDQAVRYLRRAADVNPDQRARLLTTAADILDELGDAPGARELYKNALRGAEGPAQSEVLAKMSASVERSGDAGAIVSELDGLKETGSPDLLARLGLALIARGDIEAAETLLQQAGDTATGSSPDAEARVHYGNAEILLATVRKYPNPDSIDLLQEFIDLIGFLEEGYLSAARQGTPQFATMALGRMSFALGFAADRLAGVTLPAGLSAEEKGQVQEAIAQRVETLRATSKQALEACAQQAWSNRLYNPVVRQCMAGKPFPETLIQFDRITARTANAKPDGVEELRKAIAQNPEDKDTLTQLGTRFLDAKDPHVARLILARAVQQGGGAEAQNLLGIASWEVGDTAGAFEAFANAAEGGLEAGRQNLATMLRAAGLEDAAKQVNDRFPQGKDGGRLIHG